MTHESGSVRNLERVGNIEISKLHKWLCSKCKKTNFLIFHPYNKPVNDILLTMLVFLINSTLSLK